MVLKTGAVSAAVLILAGVFSVGASIVLAVDYPAVENLLDTQTTNLGQAIVYPSGRARITSAIVTLAPGEETGRHRHPVPLYGQVLAGEVTVDYGEHGSKTYQAGDAFMEAMNTWHNGRNTGDGPLRILAVYMGADGVPNVVRP
jgi:quercetin dioxygenase-like cupin family protein